MSTREMFLSGLRKNYGLAGLEPSDLSPDPLEQFQSWLQAAIDAELLEPTAMILATADENAKPSARTVLLKGLSEAGFSFYSNYQSRKAQDLSANPQAALVFYWPELERQVRVEGNVSKLSREASEAYFKSRPHGSQLGAWVSPQSQTIAGREVLDARAAELAAHYNEGEVPLPDFWGGYLLEPEALEFWQGRPNRLHDRFLYRRQEQGWTLERLAP